MDWWFLFQLLSVAAGVLYFAGYLVDTRYYAFELICLGCHVFGRIYHGKDYLATQKELEDYLEEQIRQQAKDYVRTHEPRTAGEVSRGEKKRARKQNREAAADAAMDQVFIEERGHVTKVVFDGKVSYCVPFGKRWTLADPKNFPSFYAYCVKYFEKNKKKI